ncbi:MAG TPA: ABC transporter permease, partial [Bryobacteraceae bacterium]|nr:ABC transporter permease [Bryobacteraceae bacterium]
MPAHLLMEQMRQDARYAVRSLLQNKVFACVAIVTLALGIGASTAVFTIVNAVLLKPLPYPESDRVVMLWRVWPNNTLLGNADFPWALRELRVLEDAHSSAFEKTGAFKSDSFNLTGQGEPLRLDGIRASAAFFETLGVQPAAGRIFSAQEAESGANVVVLSQRLWQDRFAGDRGVVGRALNLNGSVSTVVGIMPAGFAFPRGEEMPEVLDLPREAQLWVPLAIPPAGRGPSEYGAFARLRPQAGIAQARAELKSVDRSIELLGTGYKGAFTRLTPLDRQATGGARQPLLLVLIAVGFVLLIACANVAGLVLARSLKRAREFALRAALGAAHGRLVRQFLTENLVLAAAGGFAGVLLASEVIQWAKVFGPPNTPRLHEASLDPAVIVFAIAVTLLAGILFGLTPVFRATSGDLAQPIKEGDMRAGATSGSLRTRNMLIVGQVAMALVLTVSAGLLVRTFLHMRGANPGFQPAHVLTFRLSLPVSKYPDAARMTALYSDVLRELRSISQVRSAGVVAAVPFGGGSDSTVIRIPEYAATEPNEQPYANYTFASSGYFSAIGTPLIAGRDFLDSDILRTAHVTIINRAMARRFWPGQNPVGKQVGVGDKRWPLRTIVGVVADSKHSSLREEPGPEMYVPYTQNEIEIWPSMRTLQVAVSARTEPASALSAVRRAVASIDPDLPVSEVA